MVLQNSTVETENMETGETWNAASIVVKEEDLLEETKAIKVENELLLEENTGSEGHLSGVAWDNSQQISLKENTVSSFEKTPIVWLEKMNIKIEDGSLNVANLSCSELDALGLTDPEIKVENEISLYETVKDENGCKNHADQLFEVPAVVISQEFSQNFQCDSEIQVSDMPINEKLFSCEICLAKFKQKQDIKRHMGIHFDVKPFFAEELSVQFETSPNFPDHPATHLNDRPFSCNRCSARFKTSARLEKHSAVHSTVKYFSCEQCSAKFRTKAALSRHSATHFSGRTFSCFLCASEFLDENDFTRHMRRDHNESLIPSEEHPAWSEDRSVALPTDTVNETAPTHRSHSLSRLDAMFKAVEDVEVNKMSINQASKKWGIPRSTLSDKLRGISVIGVKRGPCSILSTTEETILVDWIIQGNNEGFLISQEQIILSVSQLLKILGRDNRFKNDIPGKKWYMTFLARNLRLSGTIPQTLPPSRLQVSKVGVLWWFKEVEDHLEFHYNIDSVIADPSRVFSAGEAALYLNPKGQKVLFERGAKLKPKPIDCDEKEYSAVFTTVSAAGAVLPPMVVFKYERIPKVVSESVPSDWGVGRTEDGWMTPESFYDYVVNIFHKWLNDNEIPRPVLFFVDGHMPYLTLQLSQFCLANNIILIAFFPNATKLLHPLSVTIFRSLQLAWQNEVENFCKVTNELIVKLSEFCPLLKRAIAASFRPSVIANGFKKCGLVPWCPDAVDYSSIPSKLPLDDYNENDLDFLRAAPESVNSTIDQNEWKITLRKLNTLIDPNKVGLFESVMMAPNWQELVDVADSSLFSVWRQIYALSQEKLDIVPVDPSGSTSLNAVSIPPSVCKVPQLQLLPSAASEIVSSTEQLSTSSSPARNSSPQSLFVIDTQLSQSSHLESSAPTGNPPASLSWAWDDDPLSSLVAELRVLVPSPRINNGTFSPSEHPSTLSFSASNSIPISPAEAAIQPLQSSHPVTSLTCQPTEFPSASSLLVSNNASLYPPMDINQQLQMSSFSSLLINDTFSPSAPLSLDLKESVPRSSVLNANETSEISAWQTANNVALKRKRCMTSVKVSNKKSLTPSLLDLKSGDYVIVEYEKEYFPGLILKVENDKVCIKTMAKAGMKVWKWPTKEDICDYTYSNIKSKIAVPESYNRRGHYKVSEMEKFE